MTALAKSWFVTALVLFYCSNRRRVFATANEDLIWRPMALRPRKPSLQRLEEIPAVMSFVDRIRLISVN